MAYEKKVKEKKSVIIQNINANLYNEYKTLTSNLKLDRDEINKKIYEEGIVKFLHKYKKHGETISKEIDMAMQKIVNKVQKRIGL